MFQLTKIPRRQNTKLRRAFIILTMNSFVFNIALVLGLLQLMLSTPTQATDNQETFSAKLFNTIARENINQNVIISPASIQTCLALSYMGAEGTTADELRKGLNLGSNDISKEQVAQKFGNLLSKMRSNDKAVVKMANRIYVKQGYEIASEFNDVAQRYFNSSAENVNFSDNVTTAEKINNWIEQQTENKIQNLISSDDLGDETAAILVNAIYFKANWSNIFGGQKTAKKDFHLSSTNSRKVDMMYQRDQFFYGEFSELEAKALLMSYRDTNIQMLIVLPNQLEGLAHLEQQLIDVDLTKLLYNLKGGDVLVSLPKFKIEFEISLKETLETLGMRQMFSPTADFSSLFTTTDQVTVTKVKHKAFIEVDEAGTEAAGATASKSTARSMPQYQDRYDFNVDHPFYFALLDDDTVYFAGHVADI